MKFRFHALGLAHTVADPEWSACAFTMKAVKFCKMMAGRGHDVFFYGHEDSHVVCTEHIKVVDRETFNQTYGEHDFHQKQFRYDTDDLCYTRFNENAIREIGGRVTYEEGTFNIVLLFWGWGHKKIADAVRGHRNVVIVEPGIGYPLSGIDYQNHHVFESYSILNRYLGWLEAKGTACNPKFYDAVIPNYFDEDEFEVVDGEKDYFLYIGRIQYDKGLTIAIDITSKLGTKLIVAGQGDLSALINPVPAHVDFVGYANSSKRKTLLSGAKALFCPSLYSEPFGGISVEAMMSGTPVICTDWGAFPETIVHGVTGYRCHTMDHFYWASKNVDRLDRTKIREWALKNYGLGRIASLYEEYFTFLTGIYDKRDFYHYDEERQELDWLVKHY